MPAQPEGGPVGLPAGWLSMAASEQVPASASKWLACSTLIWPHPGLLGGFIIADLDSKPPVAYLETAAEGQVTERLKA